MKTDTSFSTTLARLFLMAAVAVALMLGYASLTQGRVPGCGAGGPCDGVLQSHWASVAGVPASLLGAASYLVLAVFAGRIGAAGVRGFLARAAATAAVAGGLYFMGVQVLVLKAFCPWCAVTHGLAICAVGVLLMPALGGEWPVRTWVGPLAGVVGVAVMGLVQVCRPAASDFSAATAQVEQADGALDTEFVQLHGGMVSIKKAAVPRLGSETARHLAVAVLDYTCPHCMKVHHTLELLPGLFEGNVAVLVMPGFRNAGGREIQQHVLTTWFASRDAFVQLDRALRDGKIDLSPEVVKAEAMRLTGSGPFTQAATIHHDEIEALFATTLSLMKLNDAATGTNVLPQVVIGGQVVAGADADPQVYVRAAEREFKTGLSAILAAGGLGMVEAREPLMELGGMKPGEKRTVKLFMRNSGTGALNLSYINFTQSARVLDFPQGGIDQGRSWEIAVEITAPREAGPFQCRAELFAEGVATPTVWNLLGEVAPQPAAAAAVDVRRAR